MARMWAATKAWLEAPFRGEMDAVHVFLLVGLIIVSIVLWTRILAHLPKGEIE